MFKVLSTLLETEGRLIGCDNLSFTTKHLRAAALDGPLILNDFYTTLTFRSYCFYYESILLKTLKYARNLKIF